MRAEAPSPPQTPANGEEEDDTLKIIGDICALIALLLLFFFRRKVWERIHSGPRIRRIRIISGFRVVGSRSYPKLAFVIITSHFSEKRVRPLMQMWGNSVRRHRAISNFVFLSIESPAMKDLPSITVPAAYRGLYPKLRHHKPGHVSVQLVMKDAYVMEYCVKNTSADWCFRLMDDLYINEPGLDGFVEYLMALPDPRTTIMVLGNCMDTPSVKFYLQGGSGYAFSRRAAELMVERKDQWITSVQEWEDFHLTHFLTGVGLTSQMIDSVYFTGHFIRWAWWGRFRWNNPIDYPDCPAVLRREAQCNHQMFPYHKMVFIHALKDYMKQQNWREWFTKMPRDAVVYYIGTGIRICRGNLSSPIFRNGSMGTTALYWSQNWSRA
jgi:hypothetical protein